MSLNFSKHQRLTIVFLVWVLTCLLLTASISTLFTSPYSYIISFIGGYAAGHVASQVAFGILHE